MTNNKSAAKRVLINERNRLNNNRYRSLVKTFTKKYLQSLEAYKLDPTEENKENLTLLLNLAYSKIDKAKKKNVLTKNTAARRKSRLAKALSKLASN